MSDATPQPARWRSPIAQRVAVALLAVAAVVWFGAEAPAGLALDDAYIHAAHARNLVQHSALDIVPGQPSAAVTSPLWTGLLALAWAATGDEVRAVSVLSLPVFVLLGLGLLALLRALRLPAGAALAGAALGLLTGPLLWLNASGMESALFAALALWALWATLRRRPHWLGLFVALALLTRVEGLALLGPAALMGLRERKMWGAFLLPGLALGAFVTWNLVRLDSPLPSTMAAKRFAHGVGETDLWADLGLLGAWVDYLRMGLGEVSRLPLGGWLLAALAALGLLGYAPRERRGGALWVIVVVLGYDLAYLLLLPAQGGAGRYQVLNWILPALLVPAGLSWLAQRGAARGLGRAAAVGLAALVLLQSASAAEAWRLGFGAHVTQILAAHGKAGQLLARVNEECRPVLAYDIGAIAFHIATPDCTPRLVDLGGLVEPSLLPTLRGPQAIQRLAAREGGESLLALPARADGAPLCPPLGLRWRAGVLQDPTGQLHLHALASLAAPEGAAYQWLVAGNAPRVSLWRLVPAVRPAR